MSETPTAFLAHKAYRLRVLSLIMTSKAGSGHPTSCLSSADLVATLFFTVMQFDPHDPQQPNNDRFILSKGHAAPILYAVWHELGVVGEEELLGYRTLHSPLEGHPTLRFSRSEAATGSLGQGLSIGVGMALSAKMQKHSFTTWVLLGDSELAEGSVWEAAALAAHYQLNNLVAIVDDNRLGQRGESLDGHDVHKIAEKFTAFGWHAVTVDGHDIEAIRQVFCAIKKITNKPCVIVAKTVKGYGIASVADQNGFHGKAFSQEELPEKLQELYKAFPAAAAYQNEYVWQPQLPKPAPVIAKKKHITFPLPSFTATENIATRKAYGVALAALAEASQHVVVLDAEVKNSTYAQEFEKVAPDRFIECFIAEQNMIGMAVGLQLRGLLPFASTFGAFLTRAHDQMRMAAIGRVPLRLVGSHCGVSIGEDGPSQMALEDIALMRALPDSVVLYPSDAISAYKLVELAANNESGITYIRTTRPTTPMLYNNDTPFTIGGAHVLRYTGSDVACVVGAGITVHEALKAYYQLQKQGVSIAVIDLYSIKPLDVTTLMEVGAASNRHIITVEDHYAQGGIGEAVVRALQHTDIVVDCLAVQQLPRSGEKEALLAFAGIDAGAIMKLIQAG